VERFLRGVPAALLPGVWFESKATRGRVALRKLREIEAGIFSYSVFICVIRGSKLRRGFNTADIL
jgi:hypothetical protein